MITHKMWACFLRAIARDLHDPNHLGGGTQLQPKAARTSSTGQQCDRYFFGCAVGGSMPFNRRYIAAEL
jgi:hypothetical protein